MELKAYLRGLTERAAMERESRKGGIDASQRAIELREAFRRLLGNFQDRLGETTSPRLLEHVQCDGYVRERVEIDTLEGLRMALYVLIPDRLPSGAAPAVIACHGHGYGSREIVGLEPDGSDRAGDPGLHKDFAVALVKEGYVVAAPELIGFGDRRLEEDKAASPGRSSCTLLAAHLLMTGRTVAGLRVRETMRVVDYLQERPEIDPGKIGIMGISGGGLVAGFAAALDERIRCAVVSGYASLFEDSILDRNHCLDNYIPGVLMETELPELLALIAPRGLFIESGSEDRVFPRGPAVQAFKELQAKYDSAGAAHAVEVDYFEGGHEIHGAPAYEWLRKQLMD
ncbi:MAG: dienelactone hydrolase [Paenibacillus sp.]|nr:dienelactone hydrolase [Paenibacillus sp.]